MSEGFNRRGAFKLACVTFMFLLLASCATTVQLSVQRMPNMNTSGIQRIAIMPFESASGRIVFQNAARHATNAATNRIRATNHFILVSPSTINDVRRRGESIENFVDALFHGRIIQISDDLTTQERQQTDRTTGETVTVITHIREVEVELSYYFTRARDGTIIGPVTRIGSESDRNENRHNLASVDTLVNRTIDNLLRHLNQDIAPHTVRISRTLERESNRELRPQMNEARDLVKAGNYRSARQIYLSLWEAHQSVAAAVNASILSEALGETQHAANFMQEVFHQTESPLARNVSNRLNRELAEMARLERFAGTQSLTEMTANHAVNEVRRVLPAGARLWIHNNAAAANRNLTNDVIDNMTSRLLSDGVFIIERQMIDIVLRELDFQLEGFVSDDDFVSIGHLAGANIIVTADVTGIAANRRLQIRVLDIRTGAVIMQSGLGSEWHL